MPNILFTFLYESLHCVATVGGGCLSAKAERQRCQDSTLSTAVVADYEVHKWAKFDLQVAMALYIARYPTTFTVNPSQSALHTIKFSQMTSVTTPPSAGSYRVVSAV